MFKITHGPLEFPMASTFAHPTRKGLRDHAYKFHQQRCCTRRRQIDSTRIYNSDSILLRTYYLQQGVKQL